MGNEIGPFSPDKSRKLKLPQLLIVKFANLICKRGALLELDNQDGRRPVVLPQTRALPLRLIPHEFYSWRLDFSERCDELVEVARLWLEGELQVSVVLIIKFEESPPFTSPMQA